MSSRILTVSAASSRVTAKDGLPGDGRKRRSHASQQRIVAAFLALVENGVMTPSAEQVSAEAHVGLRSVFRHFNDMESLYQSAAKIIAARLEAAARQPFKTATWPAQLYELLERRSGVYETLGPLLRAEQVHRAQSPVLQAAHTKFVAAQREILLQHLPKQPPHTRETIDAIDLLLSFEAWQRLRVQQRLSANRAKAVLRSALAQSVGAPDRGRQELK